MAIRQLSSASISTGTKSSKFWNQTTVLDPFESIATVTVGAGGQSQINFTSIPQGYKNLQIRASYTCTTSPGTLRFYVGNGSIDTGANYANHAMSGNGSSVTAWSTYGNTESYTLLESQQTYHWGIIADLVGYSDTSKYKTINIFTGGNNNGSGYIGTNSVLWKSTSGISNIRFATQSGSFDQYSKFALYGIRG